MKWKNYISDIFLYKYTNSSYFVKKKKRIKGWPSLSRRRGKYHGYYLDRVFVDYRLPDDDDERFLPIPKSRHRALKLLFTLSSAKCLDEQQRDVTAVAATFFRDWTELWYRRIGANSYSRSSKVLSRNFSNFSAVGAFARFFNTLYPSQSELTRSFSSSGKDMKDLEMDYPFYERFLDKLNINEQKFFHLKDSGDWLHAAWVSGAKSFVPWFSVKGSNPSNLLTSNLAYSNFEKLNLVAVFGSSDMRLSCSLNLITSSDSLFAGSNIYLDFYAGAAAYTRFLILLKKGACFNRVFGFDYCKSLSLLKQSKLFGLTRPFYNFTRSQVLKFLLLYCRFLFSSRALVDSLLVLHRLLWQFIWLVSLKMWNRRLMTYDSFNSGIKLLLGCVSVWSLIADPFGRIPLLNLPSYYMSRIKKLRLTAEYFLSLPLTFYGFSWRPEAIFFALKSTSGWAISIYDAIESTRREMILQFLGAKGYHEGNIAVAYPLVRAFIWSHFMKDFSERYELNGHSLNVGGRILRVRSEVVFFNSAKFAESGTNVQKLSSLLGLPRALLVRMGVVSFSLDSLWGLKIRDIFWVRRFYGGQLKNYTYKLLTNCESLFPESATYRQDFRVLLLRFLKAQINLDYSQVSPSYWLDTRIASLPPTSFLKFNSGSANVVRFAQIGAGAFHHQFFLLLNLPLLSDVATRSMRHALPASLPKAIGSLDAEALFFDSISQDFLLRGISKNVRNSLSSSLALGYIDAQTFFFDNYAKLGFFNNFETAIYEQPLRLSIAVCGVSCKFISSFGYLSINIHSSFSTTALGSLVETSFSILGSGGDEAGIRIWVGRELLYC